MAELKNILNQCRDNFGPAPRKLVRAERSSFRLRPHTFQRIVWLLIGDKMRTVIRDQNILRDQGRIVWGVLVQANQLLFDRKNLLTLPVNVIYSPDEYFDDNFSVLRNAAPRG